MPFTLSVYYKGVFGIISIITFCYYLVQSALNFGILSREDGEPPAANSTLDFGAILTVAPTDSPRVPSLVEAANLTGIEIQVPYQPKWSEQSIDFWRTKKYRTLEGSVGAPPGSTAGALGHLNALKWFVDSGMDTALILEDDVDWDIELRTKQIPRLAKSFRSFLQNRSEPPSRMMPRRRSGPWGDTSKWDLFHIGHAGDFGIITDFPTSTQDVSHSPAYLAAMEHTVYPDDTLPPSHEMHPWMRPYLRSMGVQHNHRVIQEPRRNVNSWAYAVTRSAAIRMLEAAKNHVETNNPFDVFLMRACNGTWSAEVEHDSYLRCWVLNPQLFHHQVHLQKSLIDGMNNWKSFLAPIDHAGYDQIKERNEVSNVRCGARSGAFNWKVGVQLDIFGDEDEKRLAFLQREVVAKGQCLKDWKAKFNFTEYVDGEKKFKKTIF